MAKEETLTGEKPKSFLVVGIGASAGGVQAMKEFFHNVPANSGIAYVVILHLSPDHDSHLAQVLQTEASVPVERVTAKTKIEPDHVYVVPPNQHLVVRDEYIVPLTNMTIEDRRAPVDIFFRNLADSLGPRAVCVVLSGTGANGSMGLKRVKEMGGAAFVQNPREAEFNEMPRNSIATELVDEVLPVAQIPAAIIAFRNNIGSVQISIDSEQRPEQQQQALREIFTQLRVRTGHDFTNYKRATLLRRIERRINIHNLPDLPAYAQLVQKSADETSALLKDLLISVTNFFRDKKAFDTLEQEVIPAVLHGHTADDQVRIWVAGCATGEEAYSIAMLFAEKTLNNPDAPKIQIFATDIDDAAIAVAREGFYTLNDAADVSPDRLRRFFNKEDGGYRIRREVRETVLFANHNFLKDPPFSRLHLISCRNVLIYLNHTAQERVMETFHFALRPGGYLFVGTSESVDGASDLYSVANRDSHIYQAREVSNKNYPIPDSAPKLLVPTIQPSAHDKESRVPVRTSFGELHQKLLEQYAPPSVVINEAYDIVHMSEKAGKYLEFTAGEPTQNLLKLVRGEIRLELRTALYQAVQKQTAVEARGVKLMIENQPQSIILHVRPVLATSATAKGFILVIFEPDKKLTDEMPVIVSSDEPVAKQLEEELTRLKSQLRNSNEQHEYQAEELKAANEELQAMNEELRSSAEELETSKEELQSINEELRTVNQELKIKIEEISSTSNNLQNLINSADVGTIFLDRSFSTRLFTPAVRDIFNLIPTDYGRPISDITNKLDYPYLLQDAESVLEKLTMVEREVRTTDNRYFMMRILPYRTAEDRINGVVITFFDISSRRQAEHALRQSEERLRLLIESASDYAILTQDTERNVTSWSSGAVAMLGYTEQEMMGQTADIIFTAEDRENNAPAHEAEIASKKGRAINERWHLRKDGTRFWGSGSSSALRDSDGNTVGFVKIMRDLTEKKEAEERQEFLLKLNDTIRHLSDPEDIEYEAARLVAEQMNADRVHFAEITDNEKLVIRRDYVRGNVPSLADVTGIKAIAAALKLERDEPVVVTDVASSPLYTEEEKAAIAAAKIRSQVSVGLRRMGKTVATLAMDQATPRQWTPFEISILKETAERTLAAVERAKAEDALRRNEARLQRMVNVPAVGVLNFDYELNLLEVNEAFLKIVGYTREEFHSKKYTWKDFTPAEHIETTLEVKNELMRTGSGGPYEKEYIKKDGSRIWLMLVSADLKDGTIVEYAIDINDRKMAEKALAMSEQRFRTLTDAVPQVIWSNNAQGKANYFNQRWYDYSGLTYQQSFGVGWEAIVHPDDAPAAIQKWQLALSEGNVFDTGYRLRNAAGEYRWFIGRNVPLKDETGNIAGWFGSATDINELKNAEEAVRNTADRLQLALNAGSLGTYEYDFRSGEYISTAQHKANFGFQEDDTITLDSLKERVVAADRQYMEFSLDKALAKDNVYSTEYRTLRPDGEVRWIRSVGRFVYDESGTLQKMVGITLNITEEKMFTEELSRQVKERTLELQQSNNDLRQFAHVASHDLKEPVRKIQTFNNRIMDEYAGFLPPKAISYLKKIDTATNRMTSMIDGVLRYSKMGSVDSAFEPVNLNEVIQNIESDLEVLIQDKKAVIEKENLPIINASPILMYQLFYNLLLNSLKFARNEEPAHISLLSTNLNEGEREMVQIIIGDNGIGFEQEFEHTIFETFSRLHAADEYEGTGLGLALCKKIVERHGGTIRAAGKPGKGAEFIILFPVLKVRG